MDTIANMLIMMKNAGNAGKACLTVPHSKLKVAILECLKRAGFIESFEAHTKRAHKAIDITLKVVDGSPRIHDVARVSKQSRRLYSPVKEIRTFKNGFGAFVYSTPKGILTDREAKKEMVGGEILFNIW